MNFKTFDEFWSFFVNQHSKPLTRRWHFAGTLMGFIFLVYSILFKWWFVFFVPILAYGCTWYSHFCVERNFPVSFGHHPFWSFLCDIKMFSLMLTGKMDKEIKRLGKRPVLQEGFVEVDRIRSKPCVRIFTTGSCSTHPVDQYAVPYVMMRKLITQETCFNLMNIGEHN